MARSKDEARGKPWTPRPGARGAEQAHSEEPAPAQPGVRKLRHGRRSERDRKGCGREQIPGQQPRHFF